MDTLPKVLNICFPHLKVGWNRSDTYITLPNGSEYWIGGLDDDKRVEKILGKEYSTIHFNECSQLSYRSIQVALTRLAEKNSLNKKAYYDMNPPSKVSWSFWQFIKKLNPSDNEPLKRPDDYDHLLMNPRDNLINIDEDYIEMLDSLPEKERARFLDGEFTESDDGQVYYSFNRERHVNEDIKRGAGTILIGMDFNVDPMTAVVFQIVNNGIHVFDEVFLRNSDTFKMVAELKGRGYQGTVIPDSTCKNRKTSGMSDMAVLEENGFVIPPVRNPLVIDRINNINLLLSNDRIKIHPRCKKLINDLEKVMWKDGKPDQKGEHKLLTHISDALGYGIWWYEPLIKQQKSTSYIL